MPSKASLWKLNVPNLNQTRKEPSPSIEFTQRRGVDIGEDTAPSIFYINNIRLVKRANSEAACEGISVHKEDGQEELVAGEQGVRDTDIETPNIPMGEKMFGTPN